MIQVSTIGFQFANNNLTYPGKLSSSSTKQHALYRELTETVNTGPAHTVYNSDYRGLTKTVDTGPAHTVYNTDNRGLTKTVDTVYCAGPVFTV
jgi:hypothetical protein